PYRVRVLDYLLGTDQQRQAAEAHQRLGAPRVPASLRALPRPVLAGVGAVAVAETRARAALARHLHQRAHRERGSQPRRIAGGATTRAVAVAAAAAARLGDGHGRHTARAEGGGRLGRGAARGRGGTRGRGGQKSVDRLGAGPRILPDRVVSEAREYLHLRLRQRFAQCLALFFFHDRILAAPYQQR